MRTNALVIYGVRHGDCGILDDLDAVLHVFCRVVELVQRVWGEGEGFCYEGDEGVSEVLDLDQVTFQDRTETW